MCAIALKNIEIMKRERIVEHVRENGDAFRATLEQLLDLPIVGDLRGDGLLLRARAREEQGDAGDVHATTSARRSSAASSRRGCSSEGLICRADDRGDPVIQISPPLIATQQEFDEIVGILGEVLAEAEHGRGANDAAPSRTDDHVRARREEQADQVAAALRHGVLHRLRVRRPRHARHGRVERARRASSGSSSSPSSSSRPTCC